MNRIKFIVSIKGKEKVIPVEKQEDAVDWVKQMSHRNGILTLKMIMYGTDGNISLEATMGKYENGKEIVE